MEYNLVIFDIGKTLFDKRYSTKVSDNVIRDIKELRKKRIKVGVCTMRNIKHCQEVLPVELDFYISLNGSFVVCDNKIVADVPIELHIDSDNFLSYSNDYTFYSSKQAKKKAEVNGFIAEREGCAQKIYNAVLFDIDRKDLKNYDCFTKEYWPTTNTLSLQNKETSRVKGIYEVLKFYDAELPILYFGDGPNDLQVFQTFHNCVCMGDCCPELKPYSLFQTKSCREDGIAYALRKLKLLS